MSTTTVGWMALVASLVFVVVAVAVSAQQRLALGRPILLSVARSLGQMVVVGAALVPIVDPETPLAWSWLWVAVIIAVASATVARRAPQVGGLLWVSLTANVVVAAMALAIIFGLGIFDLTGRALVPVTGMVIGNSLSAGVLAATRMTEALADHRREIEAGLALGLTTKEASRRFVRAALRTAISPQVERTAALGIVILPGAMTGLILAGVEPLDAVRAQLALMYVILAAVVISAVITGLGTLTRLSTSDHRLRYLERPADATARRR